MGPERLDPDPAGSAARPVPQERASPRGRAGSHLLLPRATARLRRANGAGPTVRLTCGAGRGAHRAPRCEGCHGLDLTPRHARRRVGGAATPDPRRAVRRPGGLRPGRVAHAATTPFAATHRAQGVARRAAAVAADRPAPPRRTGTTRSPWLLHGRRARGTRLRPLAAGRRDGVRRRGAYGAPEHPAGRRAARLTGAGCVVRGQPGRRCRVGRRRADYCGRRRLDGAAQAPSAHEHRARAVRGDPCDTHLPRPARSRSAGAAGRGLPAR